MQAFVIEGGRPLEGTIRVMGSKNASLPQMAAALLASGPVRLCGVPDLADTRSMLRLLAELGCFRVAERSAPGELVLQADPSGPSHARYEIVRTMRASICVLGPLLARRGWARVALPGGCAIGDRPIDLHLRGLAALGAQITLENGDVVARAPAGGLHGARVFLGGSFGSTVLGTANVMAAATLARGRTVIESAACEPEIVDLARLLTRMGARITGAGSPRIEIEGVHQLGPADHRVMPDRIEAGTLMCAAAITAGRLTLEHCPLDALLAVTDRLTAMGVQICERNGHDPMRATVTVTAPRTLHPVNITTQPYPGFPTDLQAQLMAVLCRADGHAVVTETIFPDRFLHVAELSRMGAQLFRRGAMVVVCGVEQLVGAPVMASDLRASASLVLAGLAARGTTIVNRVYHLDRGYERLDERLRAVGAQIQRVDERAVNAPD